MVTLYIFLKCHDNLGTNLETMLRMASIFYGVSTFSRAGRLLLAGFIYLYDIGMKVPRIYPRNALRYMSSIRKLFVYE